MEKARYYPLAVVACAAFCVAMLLPAPAAAQADHLWWAEQLVSNVLPENNVYGGNPSYITWVGVDGSTQYANRTQCNNFLTHLLKRAYGWTDDDIVLWLGSTSPIATVYHDAIVDRNGFDRISTVDQIVPGDILAISYPDGAVTDASGHIAIVQSAAIPRVSTAPVISRTSQFEIWVADSSRATHGPLDTRLNLDGTSGTGAGFGVMRLYADNARRVVGHTWSTYSGSVYHDQSSYHVVIGRLH
jgi:hypothetical protein